MAVLEIAGLHCCVAGQGRPVLTMHPGPGWDHEVFHPWLDPLAEDVRLIHHDYRGNGRSQRPASWSQLGAAQIAADVDLLRQELGLGRIVLLGYCIGSYFALEYARRCPERVAGLVLCAGSPVMDFSDEVNAAVARRATPEQLAALQRIYTENDPDDSWMREAFLTALPLYVSAPVDGLEECIRHRTRFCSRAWTSFRDTHLFTYSCLPWLHEISVPTLLIAGAEDLVAPLEQTARRMAQLLPDATLHVIPGAGHVPFAEKPQEFLAVVRGWLQTLSGKADVSVKGS